jgi:pimeloyl-ACP methyl ester carboxylesterase
MTASTTWVLLRGLTREARHWGTFPQTLTATLAATSAENVAAVRVIALDLPGNGALHGMRSPASVPAMAAHVRAELRRLGIATPVNVLAMSLGAMVATAWAVAAPDEIAAAVLINTSMRPFDPWHERLRPANYGTLLRLALGRPSPLEIESTVLQMTSNATGRDAAALLQDWVDYRRGAPVSTSNALRQLWAAARFSAPRVNPFRRLLLLASTCDRLVDARCSQRIAQHWSCDRATHAWAGHDLPLDDPAWVAQQLRDWLVLGG